MTMHFSRAARMARLRRFVTFGACILFITAGLWGCYYRPYATQTSTGPEATGQAPAAPSAQVYFYPKQGQSTEQQSRDQYECYNWAVKQTGFDPGQSTIPREQRIRVVPMPPAGYDTIAMAISGAVLGALFGGPRYAVQGAMIGATGGAIAGAASDVARQEEARMREEEIASRSQTFDNQTARKSTDFRRAMSACLEGRGYSVQ
ncbi:MAG: glycine zipper family protein [Deltaproteobacteria bacterium]|nr:glycine zipper family protein [Deltaproteobacteria bacterium]